ncbi:MAG: hypothetical protein K0R90_151 [Oscillospiraceae bacterium]|jgi:uncharacterized protein YyaL (SSP411 family)|nr:hypothetical protein [Oscillospiraceae bacterium]
MPADKNGSNRLINEKSPYLIQHAHNPVDWYPWGSEAFERAKTEDKPVFLSIGYSTCHWCHVMEHESFEDEEVAEELNRNFIAIKVDKEERPDVDSVYMNVCQALTGSGGWPMTILMTPDQKPFFAGTYFPKHSRYNLYGLMDILQTVTQKWRQDRNLLLKTGEDIVAALQKSGRSNGKEFSKQLAVRAKNILSDNFDSAYGGFGSAPKFPTPHNLMFLMRYSALEKDGQVLKPVEKTLEQMYRGGIFDHIGGGFSRYSTDRKWLVPHFEKMLYDNALLTIAYLEAYQITKKELYKDVAQKTLSYIMNEMTSDEGGFYCAQDADSEGVEGKYYVFTPDEVTNILGKQDGEFFNSYFDITKSGNFEEKNIPNLIENRRTDKDVERLQLLCKKVYDYRLTRTKLHKDDKILTSWNALMITAFAKAYQVLNDKRYLEVAKCGIEFIDKKLTDSNGDLCVRYRDGETSGTGYLDDYAFMLWALISMYETTFDVLFLKKACDLCNKMIEKFWDDENGGFMLYGSDSEQLISRPKETYDGAIPSGNSVAGYVISKLAKMTGKESLEEISHRQLSFLAASLEQYPAGYCMALIAGMNEVYPSTEVVCVTENKEDIYALQETLGNYFLPNVTVLAKNASDCDELLNIAEFAKDYEQKDGKTTYYVCQNHACSAPIHSLEQLIAELIGS